MMRLPWRRGCDKEKLANIELRLALAKEVATQQISESERVLEQVAVMAERELRNHG